MGAHHAQPFKQRPRLHDREPAPKHISTSYVERQNLTMRMSMRRYTWLTNAFSRKMENHMHPVALYFMYYNFGRVHQTLKQTPVMAAGLEIRKSQISDIVALIDGYEKIQTDTPQDFAQIAGSSVTVVGEFPADR
jgi:hypothetical protein